MDCTKNTSIGFCNVAYISLPNFRQPTATQESSELKARISFDLPKYVTIFPRRKDWMRDRRITYRTVVVALVFVEKIRQFSDKYSMLT